MMLASRLVKLEKRSRKTSAPLFSDLGVKSLPGIDFTHLYGTVRRKQ